MRGRSAEFAGSPTQDRVELTRLAEEQAALRRVATLVAEGAPSADVFTTVAEEVAQVMHLPMVAVCRYTNDGETVSVLAWRTDRETVFQPGTSWPLDGTSVVGEVLRTGRPATIEDYSEQPGTLASRARAAGHERTAGAPIVVAGRVWGVMVMSSPDAPLPDRVEDRLAEFTQLIATAISTSEARACLQLLADEQASLRRVATLVAGGAVPAEVFDEVAAEVGRLVGSDAALLLRYEPDDTFTVIGRWGGSGGSFGVGTRFPVGTGTAARMVHETQRPARVRDYAEVPEPSAAAVLEQGWRSSVGAPVVVGGRLWGMAMVLSKDADTLPLETEARLMQFTELVATAISNAEGREELSRLAEEQAALRRVATLVAEGAPPNQVFEAISAEVGRLISADAAGLARYGPGETVTPLGGWTRTGGYQIPLRNRVALEGPTTGRLVFDTGRPARIDGYDGVPGEAAAAARAAGWQSAVGAPILVDGRLWGVVSVASTTERPLPPETEDRLAGFSELLATAIANTESRAELDASRARIVATADATRQRIERDLHDGAQQQLVSLALELRAAEAAAPPELGEHRAELRRIVEKLTSALDDLREIALGIHPAILAEGGLRPALKTLARRSPVPVELDVRVDERLPEPVEVAAYYVVSEALTNAAKYADASLVEVAVDVRDDALALAVRDDGRGGADPTHGTGLIGLKDRAEALGGTISLQSPPGGGTALSVVLPLDDHRP